MNELIKNIEEKIFEIEEIAANEYNRTGKMVKVVHKIFNTEFTMVVDSTDSGCVMSWVISDKKCLYKEDLVKLIMKQK